MHDAPALTDGIPLATLQSWLLTAQTARNAFMTGAQVIDASYAQGDGQKRVTYRNDRNSVANLAAYIQELQVAIAKLTGTCLPRRRAIGIGFR